MSPIIKYFRRLRSLSKVAPQSLIIYLKGGIGDFLMLIPTLASIKHHNATVEVTFIFSRNLESLVRRYDDCYSLFDHIRSLGAEGDDFFYKIKTLLREIYFGLMYHHDILYEAWPSNSVMIKIIAAFTRAGTKIGILNHNIPNLYDIAIKSDSMNIVNVNSIFLKNIHIPFSNRTLKVPILEKEKEEALIKSNALGLNVGMSKNNKIRLIALYPHTQVGIENSKNWYKESYISLINLLSKSHEKIFFIIVGSSDDSRFCLDIYNGLETNRNVILFAGKASLYESCYLASLCDLFIGIDGGFTHIVHMSEVPSIILWGPTSPQVCGYENSYVKNIFLNVSCSPCREKVELRGCTNRICFDAIKVEQVASAVSETLNSL